MERLYLNIPQKENGYAEVLAISKLYISSMDMCLWAQAAPSSRPLERPVSGWTATEEGLLSLMEEMVQFHLTSWKVREAWNSTQNCSHTLHQHCSKDYRLADSCLWGFTKKKIKISSFWHPHGSPSLDTSLSVMGKNTCDWLPNPANPSHSL